MHHIPLYPIEITILRNAIAGVSECWEVSAIAAATPPRPDGTSIISVSDEQRRHVWDKLKVYAQGLQRNVETVREAQRFTFNDLVEQNRVRGDVVSSVRMHPYNVAAEEASRAAQLLADHASRVAKMWRPSKPDRVRIEDALNEAGVNTRRSDYRSTDAARQLFSTDGGNWSGSDLTGKAKKYGGHYVRRRREIAAVANRLGMGEIEAGKQGRLRWVWSANWLVPPPERRSVPADTLPALLTADEDDALARFAN